MHLPGFNYLLPTSISKACSMLAEYEGRASLLAGGTDLLVSMKQDVKKPEYIIDLKAIPSLNYIKNGRKGIRIGALTRIGDLERSSTIKGQFSILIEAAKSMAAPNLRNLATLGGNICLDTRCCYYNKSESFRRSIGVCLKFGGNICHVVKKGSKCLAVSQADMVPPLIVLGAMVKIVNAASERVIPIEDLYRDDGKDYLNLKPNEIVTEIQIPNSEPGTSTSYRKFRLRKSIDFAMLSAAVYLRMENNSCKDARIVLGSVGSHPIRVADAEDVLKGKRITDDVIKKAAEFAYRDAKPVANVVKIPSSYRKEMAREMVTKAIKDALSKAC